MSQPDPTPVPTIGESLHQWAADKLGEQDGEPVLVLGVVMVAEVMNAAGSRWLHRISADGMGSDLPPWTVCGMLDYVSTAEVRDDEETGEDEGEPLP